MKRGGDDDMCSSNRFLLTVTVTLAIFSITLTSCGSGGPKPEGKNFLTQETNFGKSGVGRGSAFVSPDANKKIYRKVGVMSFKAPIELAGASISDMFTTELLKTYRYKLIERSQIEQVLEEQALGLKGVTDSALALKVGKMLGVDAVIVGTVPEYGMRAVGKYELPAVGINVRMIDGVTGSIIWSITDSAIAGEPISLSVFANRMVESMVYRLAREWVRAGDTVAVHMPHPKVVSHKGHIRSAVIEVISDSPSTFTAYKLSRSRTRKGPFQEIATKGNTKFGQVIRFEDKGLLDSEAYYYKVLGVSSTELTSPPAGPFQVTTTGPPSQVTGLKAESNLPRQVKLSWTPLNEPEVKEYVIYRSTEKSSGFKRIKVIEGKEQAQYLDEGEGEGFFSAAASLGDHTTYYYKIQAVNVVNVPGQESRVASAVTKPAPVAVKGLALSQNKVKKVSVKWKPNPERDIEKYEIFRGDNINSVEDKIKSVSGLATGYVDEDLEDGKSYYYKIRAVDKDGLNSEFSKAVLSITKPIPTKPIGLVGKRKAGSIVIKWQDNPERDIAKYEIHQKGFFMFSKSGESLSPSYIFKGEMKPGNTLSFRIIAVDETGLVSEPSDVVTVFIPK